jgi:hypothetical protein
MVDLPAPLPPMTVTKSPWRQVQVQVDEGLFSLMVPG